jgi:hypothetical protein
MPHAVKVAISLPSTVLDSVEKERRSGERAAASSSGKPFRHSCVTCSNARTSSVFRAISSTRSAPKK